MSNRTLYQDSKVRQNKRTKLTVPRKAINEGNLNQNFSFIKSTRINKEM